jgi:hypothetical protein
MKKKQRKLSLKKATVQKLNLNEQELKVGGAIGSRGTGCSYLTWGCCQNF